MMKILVGMFVLLIPFSSLAAVTPIERQIRCRTHKIVQVLHVDLWKEDLRMELSVGSKEVVLEVLRPATGSYVKVDRTAVTSRAMFEEMYPGVLSEIGSWCRAVDPQDLEALEIFNVMMQTFQILYVFE